MRHGFVAPIFRAGVKKQRRFRNISRYQLCYGYTVTYFLVLSLPRHAITFSGARKVHTGSQLTYAKRQTHAAYTQPHTKAHTHCKRLAVWISYTRPTSPCNSLRNFNRNKKRQIHKQTRTNSKEIKNTNGKRVSQFTQIILLLGTFWILIGCRFGLLHHGARASVSAASKNRKCFPNSSASDGTKSYLRRR